MPDLVKVRNTTRNQIILHEWKEENEGGAKVTKRVVLGSTADRAVVGVPQPTIELDPKLWATIKAKKAIAHMLSEGEIVENG